MSRFRRPPQVVEASDAPEAVQGSEERPTGSDLRGISKGEREDLLKLVRRREKLQKGSIEELKKRLLADFERQVIDAFRWDCPETWNDLQKFIARRIAETNRDIRAHALSIGIPDEYVPVVRMPEYTVRNGAIDNRTRQLRALAKAEVDASSQQAKVRIEEASVEAQTKLMASGLSSAAAMGFLDTLPDAQAYMPPLSFETIVGRKELPSPRPDYGIPVMRRIIEVDPEEEGE